jgi:UDP-N-acetylmuramoylalanine-D-glutamate ligase
MNKETTMYLGISSSLAHTTPQDWAAKHKALGLKTVNFPVDYTAGEETYMAYKAAADAAGLTIAEVGVWRNTLAADLTERQKWIDYAVEQLKMADRIGARCCVNVVGTPYGPRWDGGYRENFSEEAWTMAVKIIQEIIDRAAPTRTKFSIESMPWMIPSSPDEYLRDSQETIIRGLSAFHGLPHRLEFLRELYGVKIYDDNFATNPSSTRVAVNAFPDSNLTIIAGGRDKTNNEDLP